MSEDADAESGDDAGMDPDESGAATDSDGANDSQESGASGDEEFVDDADDSRSDDADDSIRVAERANELARSAGEAFRDTTASGPKTYRSSRPIDAGVLGDADETLGGGPSTHVSEESVDEVLADVASDADSDGEDDVDRGEDESGDATKDVGDVPASETGADADTVDDPITARESTAETPSVDPAENGDPSGRGEAPGSESQVGAGDAETSSGTAMAEASPAETVDPDEVDEAGTAKSNSAQGSASKGEWESASSGERESTSGGERESSAGSESLSADELEAAIAAVENDTSDDFGRPKTEGASEREPSSDIGDVDLDVDDAEIGGSGSGGGVGRSSTGEATNEEGTEVAAGDSDASGRGDADSGGLLARLRSLLFG